MTFMLEVKEKLKTFYGEYSSYLVPVFKFLLALSVFININLLLGFMDQLNNIFVVLVLALICALLPLRTTLMLSFVLIVGHCYALGIEIAAFAIALLVLLAILFLRFSARDTLGILLTPIAMRMNMPSAIPIGFGLLGTPTSVFSSACGVFIYYFMVAVQEKASLIQGAGETDIAKNFQSILDGMMQNPSMWMNVLAFSAVIILVYCLRRMSASYAWQSAILAGSAAYLLIMICGALFMDLNSSILQLCVQAVLTIVLMMILRYFVFHVDYTRTELLQFEDDEYYYYVKAVPKMKITKQERSIKKIDEEQPPVVNKEQPTATMETELEKKLERSLDDLQV